MLNIFIVCHDQDIILDMEKTNPTCNYILVGHKIPYNSYSKVLNRGNIYIAEFTKNIEKFKSLLSFTAWYNISKNNLINDNEYIGIFEYDTNFLKNIYELRIICEENRIICFEPKPALHPIFLQDVNGLYEAIRFVYGFDLNYFENLLLQNNDNNWGATSNCIMPKKFLNGFVDWYKKLIPHILKYDNHPHFHERAIKLYALLNNIEVIYKPSYIQHIQANSHGYALK